MIPSVPTARSCKKHACFYDNRSASALIGAAEILGQIQTQPLGSTGTQSGQTADSGTKTESQPYTPAGLLADARRMAAGDATMLAWASQVEAALQTRTRGTVGGPKYAIDRAAAYGTVTYWINFRANEWAAVEVIGDGDTDLDLYVYDQNGNLVARDELPFDYCYVEWVPKWTGQYRIVVKNWGRVWNQFELWTN